jgi:membrane fusion protein (multidrug efflux system)
MSRRFVIAFVIVAVLLGGLGYFQLVFKPQMIRGFMSKMAPPPATVAVDTARAEQWIDRISAIGTLVSIQAVDITSQVSGIVTEVSFESGQTVEVGRLLVQLDVSVEQADLRSNQALLRDAEITFDRQTDLLRKNVTSEANLDSARAKRDTAQAAVSKTAAVIAQKSIMAPFAGRLGIRKVEKGQYVSPGMSLVTLQALDPIRVDFPVPEQALRQLRIGQTIELSVDAHPGATFRGEIEALDARVQQDTRTLIVRGRLSNPEQKLLPGMFANVAVLADKPNDVVTVARTAVTYSLYGDSVYVVPDSTPPEGGGQAGDQAAPLPVDRRFVRVGATQSDRVAIVEGLKVGERVVTSGQIKLNAGSKVIVSAGEPLPPPAQLPKQ